MPAIRTFVSYAFAAVLCWALVASSGCSCAVKCGGDAGCPAGSSCSSQYGVCFEDLTFVGSFVAGHSHACAVTTATGVKCWGHGGNGRLGDGTSTERLTPTPVADLSQVKAVAAGWYHSCALKSDGAVMCWGFNESGQVSGGSDAGASIASPVAVALPSDSGIVALGLGQSHSCALTSDGRVKCWGDNSQGQRWPADASAGPALLAPGVKATAIASGNAHVCAVVGDGGLYCWGSNTYGQANWRSTEGKAVPPTDLGLSGIETVSAGQSHTCAVTSDQKVLCWGANDNGQLGRPTGSVPTTPILQGARSVAAGCNHTCALKSDGGVFCWGSNAYGELGNTSDGGVTPSQISMSGSVEVIAAGCRHTCASVKGGTIYCWGDGDQGQLGNGEKRSSTVPVVVGF